MLFLCPRQVGAAAAAVGSQSVTESAIDAELVFARLRGLRVTGIGVVIVCHRGDCRDQKKHAVDGRREKSPRPR